MSGLVINGPMLKAAVYSMRDSLKQLGREVNVEAISDIVEQHAFTTAVSAGAAGAMTGAGSTIAFGIACASTVVMYGRLAGAVGVRLNNGLIKAVASAVCADLSAYIATTLVASALVSFVPFFGNLSSATMTGIANFAFVYVAGVIFIKVISKFGISRIESMTQDELKAAAKSVKDEIDIKAAMKEAKESYKTKS